MQTSPSINNLTKALLKAQREMGAAVKGAKNPFFKSSYADLPTVMEVIKGPLNDVGIIVLQPATHRDGRNFIQTALIHAESGEMLVSETEVICAKQNDPQAFGAAQTYARRFGLQSMLFIPAEDDDGNYASGRATAKVTNTVKSSSVAVPATLPTPVTPAQVQALTPAITAATTPVASTTQTVVEVTPLKTSSFRKPKAAKQTEVASPAATSNDGWE